MQNLRIREVSEARPIQFENTYAQRHPIRTGAREEVRWKGKFPHWIDNSFPKSAFMSPVLVSEGKDRLDPLAIDIRSFATMAREVWTWGSVGPGTGKTVRLSDEPIPHRDYRTKVLNSLSNLLEYCRGGGSSRLTFATILKKLERIEGNLVRMTEELTGSVPSVHGSEDKLYHLLKRLSKLSSYECFFDGKLDGAGGSIRYEDLPYFCGPNSRILREVGVSDSDAAAILSGFKELVASDELTSLFRIRKDEIEIHSGWLNEWSERDRLRKVKLFRGSWRKGGREAIPLDCLFKIFDVRRERFELDDFENRIHERRFDRIRRECKTILKLYHTNILQGYGCCFDEKNGLVYLAVERCEASLSDYLSTIECVSEGTKLDILLQIVEGMVYLHSKGLVLRDLNLRSIMVKRGEGSSNGSAPLVKISDFFESERADSLADSSIGQVSTPLSFPAITD